MTGTGARPGRAEIVDVVLHSLKAVLAMKGPVPSDALDESTLVLGPFGVVDSLGMVMLLVEIEQELEERFGGEVALTAEGLVFDDERAVHSVGALADYINGLLAHAAVRCATRDSGDGSP